MLKHSRDFNLTRESVLGTRSRPQTPAYDVQQACGTGLEADDPGRQQDRARADRRPASPAASTRPPTRRSRSTTTCARCCCRSTGRRATRPRAEGAREAPPGADRPARSRATPSRARACRWASTPRSWPGSGGSRARSRTSSPSRATSNLAAAYESGFLDDLVDAVSRPRARPEPASRLERGEAREAEAGVRRAEQGR